MLSSFNAIAQEPVRIKVTEQNGLPSNEVYSIEEDSKGFVWIASNKGLVRYDGTTSKTYDHPEKVGLSVFELFVDEKDRVWCMNLTGQIFYAQGDDLTLFTDVSEEFKGSLGSMVVVGDTMIVSMYRVRLSIDIKTKEKTVYPIKEFSVGSGLNSVYKNRPTFTENGKVFQVIDGTLSTMDDLPDLIKAENRRLPVRLINKNDNEFYLIQQKLGENTVMYLRKDDYWIKLETPELCSVSRIDSAHVINDALYLTTKNGLLVLKEEKNRMVLHQHFLKEFYTTDLFQDADLNIWVSTLRNGLIIIPNIHVRKIMLPEPLPKRLEKTVNNELMVGYESGNINIIKADELVFKQIEFPTASAISTLKHDEKSNTTLIFQKLKNYLYDHDSASYVVIGKPLASVKEVDFTNKGFIIAALSGTTIVTKIHEQKFLAKSELYYDHKKRGYTVLHDKNSGLNYIADVDGLRTLNSGLQEKPITYKDRPVLTRNLSQDKYGNIWAGSFKNGLFKIKGNEVIEHIDASNGLASLIVNSITIDDEYLWICTDVALQRYHIPTGDIKTLKARDGIPSFSIIDMCVIGEDLFMNTPQAVYRIDKHKVFKPLFIPDYYFTTVRVDGKDQPSATSYTIPDQRTPASIGFNANGLRGLASGKFEYRIKNKTDWIPQPQGNNTIQFATLPVGELIFELRQAGSDTVKSLKLVVEQPFYTTWWFWTLLAINTILAIIFYYRRKLRFRESEKNKQLRTLALDNELITLRLENLRSQMNPHFIFNALNSIQEYIVSNERNLASSYLVKFSRLIRMYLDQSRENQITLKEELHAMELYLELEKVRFEEKLIYQLQIDPALEQEQVFLPPLFVQPYVENALKHGLLHKKDNRELKVAFEWDPADQSLQICVVDNGIGRDASQVIKKSQEHYHKSFATYANQERVNLLNSKRNRKITVEIIDLKTSTDQACGTQVCISIPQ
ncbi:sensor histidine kinase [Nonlabens dokdonensis]|uniref:sensor histidine kinase n=1 Tax=Nonlabens dokdonensis TaxID=328515 RepID=UPI00059F04F5|nr:histidine kinase [Nonlabens dokdonensis]